MRIKAVILIKHYYIQLYRNVFFEQQIITNKRTFTLISKTWCPNSDYDQLSDVFESSFSPAVGPNRPVVFPEVLIKSLSQSIIRTQRQICPVYYFIMMSNSLEFSFFFFFFKLMDRCWQTL